MIQVIVSSVFLSAAPWFCVAGTLDPYEGVPAVRPSFVVQPGVTVDALEVMTDSYRAIPGPAPWNGALVLLHCLGLLLATGVAVRLLPPPRRHAVWAAAAMSRMRWTMARSPFERCDDRWSFNPRRPNSPGASTANTSSTLRPS